MMAVLWLVLGLISLAQSVNYLKVTDDGIVSALDQDPIEQYAWVVGLA